MPKNRNSGHTKNPGEMTTRNGYVVLPMLRVIQQVVQYGAIGGVIGGVICGAINSLKARKREGLQLIHNNFKPPSGSECK